ncbi:chitin binding peritrophin-A domain-containing protein [Streptomyces venezuelae]
MSCDLNRVPYVHQCPANTVSNEAIGVCDWPMNVPGAHRQN